MTRPGIEPRSPGRIVDFITTAGHRLKIKEKSVLRLCQRTKKKKQQNFGNMKVTVISIEVGSLGTIPKDLVRGLEDLEIKGRGHPDYCIIKIGQNTEKSPGDLREFAITQTPVKDHQLALARRIHHHHHAVLVARISLTLSRHFPYRSSPLASLLDYIPYPHIVAECMFVLVVLLLLGHVWGSIRLHHL